MKAQQHIDIKTEVARFLSSGGQVKELPPQRTKRKAGALAHIKVRALKEEDIYVSR